MSGLLYYLQSGNFVGALAFIIAVLLAIMLHELAHGAMAIHNGDMTPKYHGRMSLNPVKHFDLFGFCMFIFIGFGWAKPVPVNPSNFNNYKKGMFEVSIAGVLTNLCLAFLSYPLALLLSRLPVQNMNQVVFFIVEFFYIFLQVFFSVNISLMIFNLIPIYPLDGFRIVESLTKPFNRFVRFMETYGTYVLLGLLAFCYILQFVNIDILGFVWDLVAKPIRWFWELII